MPRQTCIQCCICLTVDFDTAEDNQVTLRDRDSMEQVRVPLDNIV
ncbi:MAG: His/Gly/Thr/Pro-type tRNA ligase C-terminal domain-containing protein, partial [Bacteroidales bacterium]|nr:His/Gly/Thr/Pro-type tRNA ligase C-terminal domain-containing protein [Bacteroidales bacterium]